MKRNIWLDGMMGVVVGDALGCPIQFLKREEIKKQTRRTCYRYGSRRYIQCAGGNLDR